MPQRDFVSRRTAAWRNLESFVDRASNRGLSAFTADELFEFARLYRVVTSDLAYAQSHSADPSVMQFLNRLIARAHAHVYGRSVQSGWSRIAHFFAQTFPAEVRASWIAIAACMALTLVCACTSWLVVMHRPSDASALIPDSMIPAHITKSLHDSNFGFSPSQSSEMSSLIITNNVKVAIIAFGAGIVTLGAFTLYIIALNGFMLGALGALYTQAGFGSDFWATIAPHGVIELTAIQIAGGAGLLLAAGVLFPGRLRRVDALVRNARRAGTLVSGVAAMLCVAGSIEAFFSPLRYGEVVRASVGALTALLLSLYFGAPLLRKAARTRVHRAV